MHSFILLALVPLALASDFSKKSFLLPRQGGDSFKPSSSTVFDCQNPCGTDWCLDVSNGDTCCTEGYACPGQSFCLTQGYCCPNGDDPATCAAANGVTLPSGFKAGQTVAAGIVASSSTAAPVVPSSTIVEPSRPASSTPASVTPVATSSIAAPFPIPVTNTTLPSPSGTSTLGGSPAVFTGGAMRYAIDVAIAAMTFVATGLIM